MTKTYNLSERSFFARFPGRTNGRQIVIADRADRVRHLRRGRASGDEGPRFAVSRQKIEGRDVLDELVALRAELKFFWFLFVGEGDEREVRGHRAKVKWVRHVHLHAAADLASVLLKRGAEVRRPNAHPREIERVKIVSELCSVDPRRAQDLEGTRS